MSKKSTAKGAALVTGGAKRIGKAISLMLALSGYDIALHYRDSQKDAQAVRNQIRRIGRQCELFACDLANEQETSLLITQVRWVFPHLNVLINNASIFEKSGLLDGSLDSLERHLAINLKAPYILSRDFAIACKKGNIINILDTHIVKNTTSHMAYLLSKKALHEFTNLAAVELAPNIRVNAIAPGLILPPGNETSEYIDRLATRIPLKKKGEPLRVLHSIQFLLENPYLTGQVIFVDGGEHLV